MIQRNLDKEDDDLRHVEAALTEANLHYLRRCVGFWRAVKPNCGVKAWLEYSMRRSTHRLATDGLQETIARLSDEELLRLGEEVP